MALDHIVQVPQGAWYGDDELELSFPGRWEVDVRQPAGWEAPALGPTELRSALVSTIGNSPLRELAKGRREVVILFDDLTRPTPTAVIVPLVLEELAEAGIADQHIRFVMATGAHGPGTWEDFAKKLGRPSLERFPVYNHNCYEGCIAVGTTSGGIPVAINAEVLHCDLRIGIGCIVPHQRMGWGGGAKIMVPGVAAIETIAANHKVGFGHHPPHFGTKVRTSWREQAEEAARLAGLDFKIDILLNGRRQPTALFAGEPIAEYDAGVAVAQGHYATEPVEDADIVVANAYFKAAESFIAVWGGPATKRKGVDLVVIAASPRGQVQHYLSGSFGSQHGGRLWAERKALPDGVERILVFSPYPEWAASHWFGPPGSVIFAQTWEEIIRQLQARHPGEVRVAVYPDRTAQWFPSLATA